MKARIQLRRIFTRAARKIGSPHGAYKQRVSGEHKPRLRSAFQIEDRKTNTVRGMPWRVHDLHARVAKLDIVAVVQRREWKPDGGGFMKAIFRACSFGEISSAGSMVCVDMRVDHMRNPEAL